jgi:EmrB/QacA subfamily drug resistance transporter
VSTQAVTESGGVRGTPPSSARWLTLGIVTIATFMLMLDITVVNVALPDLRTSLDASFSDLQWVLDSYALTLAVFLLTGGSLADRIGRKRVFNVGFLIFSAASLACGLAWDMLSLNLSRGVQGLGAAVLFAVGPALIGQEFHGKERGAAFGIFGAGAGLAIALGPLIGGGLTDGIGWRWIFLVNVPIGAVALAVGVLRMRESRHPRAGGIDWAGLVTFSAALALLVLALLRGEAEGWTSGLIVGMFAGAVVMLLLFFLVERARGEDAMFDLSLFRIATFNGISAVALLASASVMSAIFLLVSYVQNVLGYSPLATGLRFLPLTLLLFVMAAIAGSLTAKVPQRLLVGLSGTFIAAGLGLVGPLVEVGSSWTALLPVMVLLGIGMGLFNPPRAFLSIGVVEPAKAGMASGVNETFQQVGVALGIAAFGALFQNRVTHEFVESQVGRQLGPAAQRVGEAVAAGGGSEAASAAPAGIAAQVANAAESAFVNGLGDVLTAGSVVAAIAAVIGFLLIRSKDLHPSALGAVPGVLPEETDPVAAMNDLPTTSGSLSAR